MITYLLKDTPNYKNYLTKLTPLDNTRDTKAYLLHTNDRANLRKDCLGDGRISIMPAGGPRLTEGGLLPKTEISILEISCTSSRVILILSDDLPSN